MSKRFKVLELPVMSHQEAPEIPEPGKESLHLPSSPVPAQLPTVSSAHLPILPVRNYRIHASVNHVHARISQRGIQSVRVEAAIRDNALGQVLAPAREQRFLGLPHLVLTGAKDPQTDGQAAGIDHRHDPAAFATSGQADTIAPFLAGTKQPSRKLSESFSRPFVFELLDQRLQSFLEDARRYPFLK
jgi:hypothetical protein